MRSILIFVVLAFSWLPASAQEAAEPSLEQLVGTWDVSLYFSYNQPPSSTQMVISSVDQGKLKGTFYGTSFDAARARVHEGEIVFAMTTRDGSGLYATSGRLTENGMIEGQTLSVGRDFIMAWDAKRRD